MSCQLCFWRFGLSPPFTSLQSTLPASNCLLSFLKWSLKLFTLVCNNCFQTMLGISKRCRYDFQGERIGAQSAARAPRSIPSRRFKVLTRCSVGQDLRGHHKHLSAVCRGNRTRFQTSSGRARRPTPFGTFNTQNYRSKFNNYAKLFTYHF